MRTQVDYSKMTMDQLNEAYRNWKQLAWNASQMRSAKRYGNCKWHMEQIEKAQDALTGRKSYSLPELDESEYYRPY